MVAAAAGMNEEVGNAPPISCAHCSRVIKRYARGLCLACYSNSEVRLKHRTRAMSHQDQERQEREATKVEDLPGWNTWRPSPKKYGKPTEFLPGSEGKVGVLRERASCGYELFHPLDATYALANEGA